MTPLPTSLHTWQPSMRTASAVGLAAVSGIIGGMVASWVSMLGANEPYVPPIEAWPIAAALFGAVRVSVTSLLHPRFGASTARRIGVLAGLVVGATVLGASVRGAWAEVVPAAFVGVLAGAAVLPAFVERILDPLSRPPGERIEQVVFQGVLVLSGMLGSLGWWATDPGGVPMVVLVAIGGTFLLAAVAIELDERRLRPS